MRLAAFLAAALAASALAAGAAAAGSIPLPASAAPGHANATLAAGQAALAGAKAEVAASVGSAAAAGAKVAGSIAEFAARKAALANEAAAPLKAELADSANSAVAAGARVASSFATFGKVKAAPAQAKLHNATQAAHDAVRAAVGAKRDMVQSAADAAVQSANSVIDVVNQKFAQANQQLAQANAKLAHVERAIGAKAAPLKAAAGDLNDTAAGAKDAFARSAGSIAALAGGRVATFTAPLKAELNASAGSAYDAAAGVANSVATLIQDKYTPLQAKVNQTVRPAKQHADEAYRAGVGAAASAVKAAVGKFGDLVRPAIAHARNNTQGAREGLVDAFRATRKAVLDAREHVSNRTHGQAAALAPVTEPLQAALQSALGESLALTRGGVDALVAVVNEIDRKFGAVEGAIHNVTDPIQADVHYARDAVHSARRNLTQPAWDLFYEAFPELRTPNLTTLFGGIFDNMPPPKPYNESEPVRPYDPVLPLARLGTPEAEPHGQCTPFAIPAGYKHLNDFCADMQNKPKSYFAKMYNESVPAPGAQFPLDGCVFGCIVGVDDEYSLTQRNFSRGFGWSGKCFSEERDALGVPKRFGSTLNRNYQSEGRFPQADRVEAFTGAGPFVFGGDGRLAARSLYDAKPAWQFVDDRPEPRMLAAGGWRTLYSLFQMVGDGVTDEMRAFAPGGVIGKSFYSGMQGVQPDKWRQPRDTNFFMLFQACTKDGLVPRRAEQRDVPLVGN